MKVRAAVAFVIFLVILTMPFIVNAAQGNLGKADTKPELASTPGPDGCSKDDPKCLERPALSWGTVCAASTQGKQWIVENHPSVLTGERTKAVREGIRTKDHSLKNCFTCHEDKENFCDKCHDYSGVQPTCFDKTGGCHDDKGGL